MKTYLILGLLTLRIFTGYLQAKEAGALRAKYHYKIKTDTTITHVEPVIFAPGQLPVSINNNAAPAFSPDGREVYFHQYNMGSLVVVKSIFKDGKWSEAVPADFSGKYRDIEPAYSPDGKYLIFASNRPADATGVNLDGFYNGKTMPGGGGNLWRVGKTKTGWAEPERLPDLVNQNSSVFSPNIASNGDLYFMRADSGKKFHIYKSQLKNGKYGVPQSQSFQMDAYGDFDPAIAPDGSFLVFSSARPPAPKTTDLFIVFRTANGWSAPYDLRELSPNVHGVEARLSPDSKTLYFTNQRNADGINVDTAGFIWMVDIAGVLRAHGIVKVKRK